MAFKTLCNHIFLLFTITMCNRYKQFIGAILLLVLTGISLSARAQVKPAFIQGMTQAIQDKDASLLKPYLSPVFTVAGHHGEGANFRLNQIVSNYPLAVVTALAEKKVSKGKIYDLEFLKQDGKVDKSQALVDPNGKLLYINLFDQLYGLKRHPQSALLAQIPFENHNGSIILTVQINALKRPIKLLFDTGADGMAVSQALADEIGLKISRENNASVVGGNKTIQVSDGNTVLLDTLTLSGMGIAIFPEMGRDHAEGIIGNSLVRKFITHIDYDNNLLSLYSFGPHNYQGKGQLVPITMPSGVLLLPGQLDIVQGKSYAGNFVFDTGAAYDLICFRPFVRQNKLLVSGFKPEVQAATVSMGISSPTFLGQSYQFALSPLPAMAGLPVTLMGGSSANESWDPGADGSIGVRLLSRYNMTINLADSEVYFSPNKLYPYPQDFVLAGYQFGWNNKAELVVLSAAGSAPEVANGLKPGDVIQHIAGLHAQNLLKKPSLIADFQAKAKAGSKVEVKLLDHTIIML